MRGLGAKPPEAGYKYGRSLYRNIMKKYETYHNTEMHTMKTRINSCIDAQ